MQLRSKQTSGAHHALEAVNLHAVQSRFDAHVKIVVGKERRRVFVERRAVAFERIEGAEGGGLVRLLHGLRSEVVGDVEAAVEGKVNADLADILGDHHAPQHQPKPLAELDPAAGLIPDVARPDEGLVEVVG